MREVNTMLLSKIVNGVNAKLAGELLSLSELTVHLDSVVDEINAKLNAKFPVFSELEDATEYTAIPDKYIRTVIIPGAAYYFYTTDEEGAMVAPEYKEAYYRNLFYMERDYMQQIPAKYLESELQGSIDFAVEADGNIRGITVPSSTWFDC